MKYTIVKGDTFPKLAIKYYKDVNLWRPLGNYNLKNIRSKNISLIYPDELIEIPDKSVLQKPVPPKVNPPAPTSKKTEPPAEEDNSKMILAGFGLLALFFFMKGKKKR